MRQRYSICSLSPSHQHPSRMRRKSLLSCKVYLVNVLFVYFKFTCTFTFATSSWDWTDTVGLEILCVGEPDDCRSVFTPKSWRRNKSTVFSDRECWQSIKLILGEEGGWWVRVGRGGNENLRQIKSILLIIPLQFTFCLSKAHHCSVSSNQQKDLLLWIIHHHDVISMIEF